MLVIERVRIKNFRSIVDGVFDPAEISLIVGANDVGKSNYIRALNLFFNGETEIGRRFDFGTDFSFNAVVGKGKARQIEIALNIRPPSSFADTRTIVWRRYWREESASFISETFHRTPGSSEIPLKSKPIQWLRGMRFRYVPAIKGADYFAALLRELHDTLAATIDSELRSAAGDFIGVVRAHTAGISEHLAEYINLESKLQLPGNLRSLFEVLDFSTVSSAGANISLRLRGDGIKVRHIPAVLKFLADQERRLAAAGKPRPTSIWGYEEPENNLEMRRAFEHAEELFAARGSAQIFVTTHSPAFYGLAAEGREDEVRAFSAQPDSESGTQLIEVNASKVSTFDDDLGLMPLIAPYINKKVVEIAEIRSSLNQLRDQLSKVTKPMILVAGETDALYVQAAIAVFDAELSASVEVLCVGKQGVGGSAGTGDAKLLAVVDQWNLRPELLSRRAMVLLDCDVEKVPVSVNDKVTVVKLPLAASHKVTRKGIENLFPEDIFSDDFYSISKQSIDYGGEKIVKTFNKMRLCQAICVPDGALYARRAEVLAGLRDVVILLRRAS